MKLSTRGRYGTRAMLDIALHGNGLVRLKDIAERQGVSKKYLEQLVARLEADGLVRTARGAGGGVSLSRAPSEITVLDILTALEGSLAPVECVDHPETCPRSPACGARDLWLEMDELMTGFLRSLTLDQLCDRQRKKDGSVAATYDI
jgi:Rrf2 family protein